MAEFQIPCCMQPPMHILQISMSLCPGSPLRLGTCIPKLPSMTLNDPQMTVETMECQGILPWVDCHHPCAHFDMAQAHGSTKEALALGTYKLFGPFSSISTPKPTLG